MSLKSQKSSIDKIIRERNMKTRQGEPIHSYGSTLSDLILWLIYTHLISKIPYGLGGRIRGNITRRLFKGMGAGTSISIGVRLIYPQGISLGNNVGITRDVTLDGRGGNRNKG